MKNEEGGVVMRNIKTIKQEIKDLQNELLLVQDNCIHEQIIYEYKSNTGNYDPCSDSYWVEIECLCCEKKFSYEDYESGYRSFSKNFGSKLCLTKKDYAYAKRMGLL